jgi:uncharacterized protein YkwD/LysM repeat protein
LTLSVFNYKLSPFCLDTDKNMGNYAIKKKNIITLLAVLCLSFAFITKPDRVQAQAGEPYEVLAEINALRAANGLEPLKENQYLNIAAQNHADWIAEDPAVRGGHTGEGGTDATDRALAVGYGEGKQVWVTENWARGINMTASEVVYDIWQPSSPHFNNMTTTWHNEFGAGVALDIQGLTVYVVNFGHSGSAVIQPTITPGGPTSTTAPIIQPVLTATPNPDGSVIHIVQYGQTLWAIADAYEIPLADLLSQNGLTEDSAIFPEEQLVIVPGAEGGQETTETTSGAPGKTETQEILPSSTLTPTKAPERTPTLAERTATPTETPKTNNFLRNIFSGDTLWVGIGLVAVSVFGIVLLLFTSARLR